jgi:hypothetical protein
VVFFNYGLDTGTFWKSAHGCRGRAPLDRPPAQSRRVCRSRLVHNDPSAVLRPAERRDKRREIGLGGKLRLGVGPPRATDFGLRSHVDQTGVRTAPPRTVQNPSGAPAASNAAASRSVPVRAVSSPSSK